MNDIELDQIRHPKESTYLTIMYVFSIIIYVLAFIPIIFSAIIALPFILISVILAWISSMYFKAQLLGNSVKVSSTQYPDIHNCVLNYCKRSGISKIPDVYMFNGGGLINAFALKVFMKKYVMLSSSIVDISFKKESMDELNFVIAHELGHHAAQHTSVMRSVLTGPAKIIPFLGGAYSRACELTADRYGLVLTNNKNASINALINVAHGSKVLSHTTNIEAFMQQENEIPELMGFISKIYATHPRLTVRVKELKSYQYNPGILFQQQESNSNISPSPGYMQPQIQSTSHHVQSAPSPTGNSTPLQTCSNCKNPYAAGDLFCESCGSKLN